MLRTDVAVELAEALIAMRRLLDAVAAARPDGAELLPLFVGSGLLRVVLDERSGTIGIGIAGPQPGDPCTWLETIAAQPSDEATFGRLESRALLAAPGRTH